MRFEREELPKKLKFLRKKAGLTQFELSEQFNIERSAYAYYETGKTAPGYALLVTLCQFYEVTTDWMLTSVPTNEYEKRLNQEIKETYK